MSNQPVPTRLDSWQIAEDNAAAWMRYWGHQDAHCTGGGPDGGVDVRSAAAIAQVKFEASQVGSPAVQRPVGARGLEEDLGLYFFSGAGYARPAMDYATSMGVALFQYALDGSMQAVNPPAAAVLKRAKAAGTSTSGLAEVLAWAATAHDHAVTQAAARAGFWRRHGWAALFLLAAGSFLFSQSSAGGSGMAARRRRCRWGGGRSGPCAVGVAVADASSFRRPARRNAGTWTPACRGVHDHAADAYLPVGQQLQGFVGRDPLAAGRHPATAPGPRGVHPHSARRASVGTGTRRASHVVTAPLCVRMR